MPSSGNLQDFIRHAASVIAQNEGFRSSAYPDSGDHSIGYGFKLTHQGKPTDLYRTIQKYVPGASVQDFISGARKLDRGTSDRILQEQVKHLSEQARSILGERFDRLSPSARTAVVDSLYNSGTGRGGVIGPSFRRAFTEGDDTRAAMELLHGVKQTVDLPGLAERYRRNAEMYSRGQGLKLRNTPLENYIRTRPAPSSQEERQAQYLKRLKVLEAARKAMQ